MFLSEWREFLSAPCLVGGRNLMTVRVSILLKSRASLTCFRACFLPGRAKDLSATRVYMKHIKLGTVSIKEETVYSYYCFCEATRVFCYSIIILPSVSWHLYLQRTSRSVRNIGNASPCTTVAHPRRQQFAYSLLSE